MSARRAARRPFQPTAYVEEVGGFYAGKPRCLVQGAAVLVWTTREFWDAQPGSIPAWRYAHAAYTTTMRRWMVAHGADPRKAAKTSFGLNHISDFADQPDLLAELRAEARALSIALSPPRQATPDNE